MSSSEVVLQLTKAEADALFGMAAAGEHEWAETVDRSPDDSPQKRTARLAAGQRAMQKLRDA